jgi:NAD(P)-dependent dehydrogenase (short-subunit alcohol dehydrogenase family)
MSGRIIFITGAKGGLGNFVSKKFLDAGEMVIGAALSIRESDFNNANFIPVPLDLTDADAVRGITDDIVKRFGHIDVLVHVAGGFAGGTPIHETDPKTWSKMQNQNLNAAFNVARAVIPHMRKEGRGRFIAVGSKAAEQAHPNLGAYVVSKNALAIMMKTLAMENADRGLNVNMVLPGTMDTPGNRAAMPDADPKQWVNPALVANVIFWLASKEASQTNGAAIPVSGREI